MSEEVKEEAKKIFGFTAVPFVVVVDKVHLLAEFWLEKKGEELNEILIVVLLLRTRNFRMDMFLVLVIPRTSTTMRCSLPVNQTLRQLTLLMVRRLQHLQMHRLHHRKSKLKAAAATSYLRLILPSSTGRRRPR
jgi:hypothetical protein